MPVTRSEPGLDDWDAAIERAQAGTNAEEKLLRTVELLTVAQQRSRLRGNQILVTELGARLNRVHELLDLM